MEGFGAMSILSWPWPRLQRKCARVRPRLKAALVDIGLRLMSGSRSGPVLTGCVQRVFTLLVRWTGLADV
jgi:hypothetical protein